MALFDIATWTFIGTWTLVIGTIVLMWWQTRTSRILNSANSVIALRERFSAPEMRRARRTLAKCLRDHRHEDVTNLEVAAFFELIGALTHTHLLEEHLVWEAFGTWIDGYYTALRHPVDLIGQARVSLRDPLLFHEFEWLRGRITLIDQKMLGAKLAATVLRDDEVLAFLEREAELDSEL